MPRGGKRAGAGKKPHRGAMKRYRRRSSIGRRTLALGLRCEERWREACSFPWNSGKEPREMRSVIIDWVAAEVGETPEEIEKLWDDYRHLETHLRKDLPPV